MLLNLTDAELLEYRRNMAGLEPALLDFSVERTDGIDISLILRMRLRGWYLKLLDSAPADLLPVENVASESSVEECPDIRSGRLTVPQRCRRILGIRIDGWEATVPVLPAQELPNVMRLQQNPFTAATEECPVAIYDGCGSQSVIVIPHCGDASEVRAVTDPGDGHYILDEALLQELPADDFFLEL